MFYRFSGHLWQFFLIFFRIIEVYEKTKKKWKEEKTVESRLKMSNRILT